MNYSSAILSQWDQFYPIEAWAADDFSFENDTYINGVNWIGFYTSKSKCQDDQFDMQITFFLDRGDGCAPGDVAYGPIFFPNLETNETFIENYWYSYNITFTEVTIKAIESSHHNNQISDLLRLDYILPIYFMY